MDMSWITGRIAVGGGIWTDDQMALLVNMGITHIINMQIEFDDNSIAAAYDVKILWNATDDDFQPKPAHLFQKGVDFAMEALDQPDTKLYIHCAAGVHRAPMMTLAVLRSLGYSLDDASNLLESRRNVVDLADVYVRSVEEFMKSYEATTKR
jgi:protein-tyrosine phosphatase